MTINNQIQIIEKILVDKTVTTEHTAKQITTLFNLLTKEYSPNSEIKRALNFQRKWERELKEDRTRRHLKTKELVNHIDNLIKKSNEITDQYEKGLPIKKVETTFPPIENWNELMDLTNFTKLFNQLDIVVKLHVFRKGAKSELLRIKLKFYVLNFIIKTYSVFFFLAGAVFSYFVGLILEKSFDINPLLIAIIGATVCLYSSDKFLRNKKEYFFWNYTKKLFDHLKNTSLNFSLLKTAFNEFVKKNPEVIE